MEFGTKTRFLLLRMVEFGEMVFAGVVLVQSLQLTGFFQYGVRLAAETENYFTSVERIQAYSQLPTEADPETAPGIITEEWPQNGEVEFVHYTMAYREDLPPVLNDLCFKVGLQPLGHLRGSQTVSFLRKNLVCCDWHNLIRSVAERSLRSNVQGNSGDGANKSYVLVLLNRSRHRRRWAFWAEQGLESPVSQLLCSD